MEFDFAEDLNEEKTKIKRKKEKKISSKKTEVIIDKEKVGKEVDNIIKNIVNERLLNLIQLGLTHELTIKNMKQYFKEIRKAKLYEVRRYFSNSKSKDINEIIQFLHKQKFLYKDRNGWYRFNEKILSE